MSEMTLAQAIANRDAWVKASEKVAAGQSYSIGNRTLTRADAGEIRKMIDYWEAKVRALSRSRRGFKFVRGAPR
jgi:hypothetical protein